MGQNGRVAATANFDGRFEVFLQNSLGVHHYWQAPGSLNWVYYGEPYLPASYGPTDLSVINPLDPDYRDTIVAGRDGTGRIMAAWISLGSVYFVSAPWPGSSLNIPGNLIYGLDGARSLALGQHSDGTLEIFALVNGQILSCHQEFDGVWVWGGTKIWSDPSITFSQIAAGTYLGALVAFGLVQLDSTGVIASGNIIGYDEPSGPGLSQLAVFLEGYQLTNLVVAESIDHRLEIFAVGSDSLLYHQYQSGQPPHLTFSGWQTIDGSLPAVTPPMQVVSTGDGRMQAIAYWQLLVDPGKSKNTKQQIVAAAQTEPNGGFSSFNNGPMLSEPPLVYPQFGPTVAIPSPNGSAALFVYTAPALAVSFATIANPTWTTAVLIDKVYG
jgi:hypothetical protein